MGLHKGSKAHVTGEIWLAGQELVHASEATMRSLRWQRDGDDLPGPAVGAAPVLPGREPDLRGLPGAQQREQGAGAQAAIEMLDLVGIPNPTGAIPTTRTSSPAACGSAP
jgi:peptide/nickel transport system ATP-binding protein